MTIQEKTVFLCSCEETMPIDLDIISKGCDHLKFETAHQLCRSQIEKFKDAISKETAIAVGCTQEETLFREIASDTEFTGELLFTNIRERAGWSRESLKAGPKISALLAASIDQMPPTQFVNLKSEGVALIVGTDQTAVDVGNRLAELLDITVMISGISDVVPPKINYFPIARGNIRQAKGYLGAFEVVLDDFALPAVSSRAKMTYGGSRDGAVSNCEILIDLTGRKPLFPLHDQRSGYLRADPGDPVAVERLIFDASQLVGQFDHPKYVDVNLAICAHSRSKKIGCSRCLDLCPTGAISPLGEGVSVDPYVCAGCGGCAAVCPTGAIAYALPPENAVMTRLRTLLLTYDKAGGQAAVLLLHDGAHGEDLVDALARFGDGLPANVIPVRLNEITQLGLAATVGAVAWGAARIAFLGRARPRHDISSLHRNILIQNTILSGLGFVPDLISLIETDDPDDLGRRLYALSATAQAAPDAGSTRRFAPLGSGRPLLKTAILELQSAAPRQDDASPIALPPLSPFGAVRVDTAGCTLCLSCVSACPTGALLDDPARPALRFDESACVQCGLCAATCPERVITLEPRLDLAAWAAPPVTLKQEEPALCIACGAAFGVKSTIDRVVAKLENRHWMFAGDQAKRVSVLRMCEPCRVEVVVNESFDPHKATTRPSPRTTDDYLRERAERGEDPLN